MLVIVKSHVVLEEYYSFDRGSVKNQRRFSEDFGSHMCDKLPLLLQEFSDGWRTRREKKTRRVGKSQRRKGVKGAGKRWERHCFVRTKEGKRRNETTNKDENHTVFGRLHNSR